MTESLRRPMSAALRTVELPPEAVSLIKAGSPRPLTAEKTPEPEQTTNAPRRSAGVKSEAAAEPIPTLGHLSIRLPAELPQALLRASLDRKLKRLRPWTQQDIVADALDAWLRKHGYLQL
jgi:hypothetical protein